MVTRRIVVWLALAWSACGGGIDDVPRDAGPHPAEDAGPPAAEDAALGDAQRGKTLALPLVPVTTQLLAGVTQLVTEPVTKVVAEEILVFALGDGYPTEMLGTFATALHSSCGVLRGTPTVHRLEGANSSIAATLLMDPTAVRVNVKAEGTAELVLFGEYQPAAEEPCGDTLSSLGSVPFEMHIKVFAWRPIGVQWDRPEPCDEAAPVLLATSSAPELDVHLVNADGDVFYAQNVLPRRQVSLTLEADTERSWTLPSAEAGLADLRWPDTAGEVTLRAALGEPLTVSVVDASSVTSVKTYFVLGGLASTPVMLDDGASFGETGWRRTTNRIVPVIERANVGEAILCSVPNPAWFELVSDTPLRCDVRSTQAGSLDNALVVPKSNLGLSSYVRADGACTLRLHAKDLDNGKGFEQRFTVTLLNVAMLAVHP